MKPSIDDATVSVAAEQAAEWAGLSTASVSPEIVRRALQNELARGTKLDDLRRRAGDRDPGLMRKIRDDVTVRETFFFRNPDQFNAIERFAYHLLGDGRRQLRAWCAGCATGEEAYSLAATLFAVTRDPERISVLATDVQEHALELAHQAVYRRTSIRPSGPLLHPVLAPAGPDGTAHVLDPIRALVTFQVHDLRDPPPTPAHFDLIMCRNVLVYFARPVAQQVCAGLASALGADGVIVFGAMDIDAAEVPMLVHHGGAEHQMFKRPAARAAPKPSATRNKQAALPRVDRAARATSAIEAHRAALVLVERGRRQDAERALRDLTQRFPEYVPGLLERALFDARHGELADAIDRMRGVLATALERGADEQVAGIELLPASFYVQTAREFLRRHGQEHK